jgi:phospholipid/cholesterol/gamma-HCH transport system substrate-binding protein
MIYKFGDLPTAVSKLGSFEVFVQFPTAPGVQKDTPVRFCGYQIGKVTEVMAPEIRQDLKNPDLKYHQTVVVLSIDEDFGTIPSNVEIKLMTRGLGSSYIELEADPEKVPAPPLDPNRPVTVHLIKNMWLQGSSGIASEFFPKEMQEKLEKMVAGIGRLVASADAILGDEENQASLKKTLSSLPTLMDEAIQTVQEARVMVDKIREFAGAGTMVAQNADTKLDELVPTIVETSGELGKTASELRAVLGKVNEGRGSAGKFVNDGRLYESLLDSTDQMQLLLEDLKLFIVESRDKGLPLKLK